MNEYLKRVKRFFEIVNLNSDNFNYSNCFDLSTEKINEIKKELNCSIENGLSKLVLVFNDLDFVIKIPFIGEDEEEFYNSQESLQYENDKDYNFFDWDYCGTEYLIYQIAKEFEVEKMFLETKPLDEINGLPVYIQEKAIVGKSQMIQPSEKSKQKYSELLNKGEIPYYDVMQSFIEYYGDLIIDKFTKFLERVNLGDLHSGNIGVSRFDNRPIMFDYSGYFE